MLGALCLLVVCGMLTAGLWPFHAPRNRVSWINHSIGLSFTGYGSVVNANVLTDDPPNGVGACSLEIWMQPTWVDGKGTVLGFYKSESRAVPIAIRQFHTGLVLEHSTREQFQSAKAGVAGVYVDKLFTRHEPVVVAITSNGIGTTVYADGVMIRKADDFGISSQDCSGHMVAGNSPIISDSWIGELRGLAIYHRELTSNEVSEHAANWTKSIHADIGRSDGPAALYLFEEGHGKVVRNQVETAPDLIIPDRFFVLDQLFLEPPWDEYRPGWSYWKANGFNILGFIPLGFLFSAFLSSSRNSNTTVARTILLGFIVSLTIEVFQAFLPTRNSGMTDLITNTFGTGIGASLFRYNPFRALCSHSGFSLERTSPVLSLKAGAQK